MASKNSRTSVPFDTQGGYALTARFKDEPVTGPRRVELNPPLDVYRGS